MTPAGDEPEKREPLGEVARWYLSTWSDKTGRWTTMFGFVGWMVGLDAAVSTFRTSSSLRAALAAGGPVCVTTAAVLGLVCWANLRTAPDPAVRRALLRRYLGLVGLLSVATAYRVGHLIAPRPTEFVVGGGALAIGAWGLIRGWRRWSAWVGAACIIAFGLFVLLHLTPA